MIGEDDRSVALGDTSHCHMENAMWSLNVMLLQQTHKKNSSEMEQNLEREKKMRQSL